MRDGDVIADEIAVADAHPLGARPFGRAQYVEKFRKLTAGVVREDEQDRFLELVQRLPLCRPEELDGCTLTVEGLEAATPIGGLL
jgi:2-methylcitrate dehydratase